MTVKELIVKTRCSLKNQGYQKHRIWDVNRTFKKFLDYCKDAEHTEFNEELIKDFYKNTFQVKEDKNSHCEEIWSAQRAIQMLKEVISTGNVIKKNYTFMNQLSTYYTSILDDYTEDCYTVQHLASVTVVAKCSAIKDFMITLENHKITDISKITIEEIEGYLLDITHRQAPSSIYANMGRLKGFIKYLVEKAIILPVILLKWPKIKPPAKNANLIEIFTPEVLKVLLASIDRANSCGKRLYAMTLLSLTTGMRGGEVCNIEFEDIDWRESSLMFTHEKSGKKSISKIQPAAGNAIVDYIVKGRPKSDKPFIFLQKDNSSSNFKKMENSNYSKQLSRQIELCGLKIDKLQSTGSHALRHAFASMLLRENTELPVISEILGHSNTSTTAGYTKIDIDHLRECALDITYLLDKKEDDYDW
ncbi:MAG: tyrosine-type recombinase/integrase [Sphaerochaetaceae bacterium]|nr:tyrosine-type recombinase/integrase [Sphaerochaetaceae bacterium]